MLHKGHNILLNHINIGSAGLFIKYLDKLIFVDFFIHRDITRKYNYRRRLEASGRKKDKLPANLIVIIENNDAVLLAMLVEMFRCSKIHAEGSRTLKDMQSAAIQSNCIFTKA